MSRAKDSIYPPLWVLTLLLMLLTGWLVYQLKELCTLLLLGYCIAYVINPWLNWFEQRKVPRSLGVFLIIFVLIATLLMLALTAMPTISREFNELTEKLPSYLQLAKQKVSPLIERVREMLPASYRERQLLDFEKVSAFIPDLLRRVVVAVWGALLGGYSAGMAVLNLLLLPFIVFYLAVDFQRIHNSALALFPLLKREKIRALFVEINGYVSAFVSGQLLVCFILFVLYSIGLYIVGVELWFLLGVIAGFGNIVPYLGFLLGIVLSSIMALATFGDMSHLFMVWGVFALVQFLEGSFITPAVLGERVGLSPLVVILAVVAGGSLFGLLGIFLAVPSAAVLKVLLSHLASWVIQRN